MMIRSTDSGMPALTGEIASLYAVLKAALPPLGWTLEYDDPTNSRAAFRNSPVNGTGDYLRIADNPADHDGANAKTANVRSYASMTDIDTGIDAVGDAGWLICKSMSADSTPRPWAVIGDERYFWLLIASGNDNFYQEYYFGDIEPDKPGDAGAFMTQASTNTDPVVASVVTAFIYYGGGPSGLCELRYDLDLSAAGVSVWYTQENISNSTSTVSGNPGSTGPYPEPASGGLRVVDIVVQESGGVIRGRLRGSVRVMNNIIGEFSNWHEITNQATARGLRDCVVVNRYTRPNSSSTQGVLLFDPDHEGAW